MARNKVTRVFLILIGVPSLVYAFFAGRELLHYFRLDAKVPLESLEVKPIAIDSERYGIQATYTFLGQKQVETLTDPLYLNAYAAEKGGERLKETLDGVWVNSDNLQESSLQKSIPYKKCAYTLILLGLFFYFLILGRQGVHGRFNT
jgi:hypothetical protein